MWVCFSHGKWHWQLCQRAWGVLYKENKIQLWRPKGTLRKWPQQFKKQYGKYLNVVLFVYSFSQVELIKETIQSWNWYVINMRWCWDLYYILYWLVKILWIIINLDFHTKRNNELFYFEQPSINHLSKSVSYRQPINNRIFDKFMSDLTGLQFIFSFILLSSIGEKANKW